MTAVPNKVIMPGGGNPHRMYRPTRAPGLLLEAIA